MAEGGKTDLVERIARVLAGAAHSSNAGNTVDLVWKEHFNQALAVLHAIREPDEAGAAAGDPDTWQRMVEASIAKSEPR